MSLNGPQPQPVEPRFNWELGTHAVHRHDAAAHQHLQMAENYWLELNQLESELGLDVAMHSNRGQWLHWRIAHHRQMATLHAQLSRVHPEWTEHNS